MYVDGAHSSTSDSSGSSDRSILVVQSNSCASTSPYSQHDPDTGSQPSQGSNSSSDADMSTLSSPANGTLEFANEIPQMSEARAIQPTTQNRYDYNGTCNMDLDGLLTDYSSGNNLNDWNQIFAVKFNYDYTSTIFQWHVNAIIVYIRLCFRRGDVSYKSFRRQIFASSSPKPPPQNTRRKIIPSDRSFSSSQDDDKKPVKKTKRKTVNSDQSLSDNQDEVETSVKQTKRRRVSSARSLSGNKDQDHKKQTKRKRILNDGSISFSEDQEQTSHKPTKRKSILGNLNNPDHDDEQETSKKQ